MSEISKLIDDVTRRGLAIALKKPGYRKSGRTFYLVNDDRTEIVNVQASQGNMAIPEPSPSTWASISLRSPQL